jgi:hypothetical protein
MPISVGSRSIFGETNYTPLLQDLTATLDRDNVAVYPVRLPGSLAPADGENTRGTGFASSDTLEQFAGLTGGRAFGADIAAALAQAANDTRTSYLVAFDPPLDKWDGKYHKLRVECGRSGVRLFTKQGYYAFAEDAHEGDQERAAISTGISRSFDIPEIGLHAGLSPSPNPREMTLDVRIDVADLMLELSGGVFTGQLAVTFAAFLDNGTTRNSSPGTISIRLDPTQRETALKEGVPLKQVVTLGVGLRNLRVIVLDRMSGAIGSLTIPIPDSPVK